VLSLILQETQVALRQTYYHVYSTCYIHAYSKTSTKKLVEQTPWNEIVKEE